MLIVGLIVAAAVGGNAPVCQELGVPQADGSITPTLMCKGADDRWRPAASAAPKATWTASTLATTSLPDRSEVTYEGTFDIRVSKPVRMPSQLSLNSLVNSVRQSQGRSTQGTLTLATVFAGPVVTARVSGTGGLRPTPMSGQIENGRCRFVTSDQLTVYDGQCGPRGFSGRITAGPRNREDVSGTFRLRATKIVDIAERERQQKLAAAEAAKARAAAIEAERSRLAALPEAGPVYAARLTSQVQTDARGWAFNHLDPGSVHNVKVAAGSIKSGNFVLRAEYTYNGGSPGSVLAQYASGKFDCIQFWDAMVGCRGLRTAEQGEMTRSLALGVLTGGGGGGEDSSNSGGKCDDNCVFSKMSTGNGAALLGELPRR